MYQEHMAQCEACVCTVSVYVLARSVKGLKRVHDSVKALTPTLSSVCKNTGHHIVTRPPLSNDGEATVTTVMQIQTPDMIR